MPLAASIIFGSVVLDGSNQGNWLTSLNAVKAPGSLKSRFNENVTITEIPGRAKEWQITISGNLQGANMESNADTLEGYDNGSIRNFSDGDHNGDYIIVPGTFGINRENTNKTVITYRMTIRQYTQVLP